MGNSNSSLFQLQDEYDNMIGVVKVLQNENKKLKLERDKLNSDKNGLMQDIKTEKIKRIHIEKNIAELLDTSICDEYILKHKSKVLDQENEKQLLYKFILYTKNEWADIFNKNHKT